MTQEDKQLLLEDLCARLPYGVKIIYAGHSGYTLNCQHLNSTYAIEYLGLKPYLRPLSSMTGEEIKELGEVTLKGKFQGGILGMLCPTYAPFDWLNSHHFDYRGLIEKGLAIEVTEDNNPYKD